MHEQSISLFALDRSRRGGMTRRKQVVALYDELRPSLYGYLCCVGLTAGDADDVVQETFLRMFRDFTGEMTAGNVRPWVFRVAQYVAADEYRKRRRLVDVAGGADQLAAAQPDLAPNPEESLARREQFTQLNAAAAKLTPQQRQCLHLRAEGLRYREIAGVLGVSVARVAVVLEKALAQLAGNL